MHEHHERNTGGELYTLGLMTESVHGHECAKATSDSGCDKQNFFGDAAFSVLSPPFINKHKQESCCINYSEVAKDEYHFICSFQEGFYEEICVYYIRLSAFDRLQRKGNI